LACYDDAIAVVRRLVEVEGRTELANDLATALMNKALLLEKQEQWQEALGCYEEAIRWQETCVGAGMSHLLPDLLRTVRYRLLTLLDLRRWPEAAADVLRILSHALPVLQTEAPPESVVRELASMTARLRQLSGEEREHVYAALGEWADTVRGWVEG
jgi:tetratricopeptide (TPR) repeat protein